MSELKSDQIIIDSDKQFRLRIDGFLRSLGLYQIIGTRKHLEIEFVGGEYSVRVLYPRNMEDLHEAIKRELLGGTQLGPKEIDNIRFYINDHVDEIEKARKGLTH